MIILNPQWQGIGRPTPIPDGAKAIGTLLNAQGFNIHQIPLDGRDLEIAENVKGLTPITALTNTIATLLETERPRKIFTCGGDCSSDFAQLTYLNALYGGDMALIWVDAHADLNTPASSPSKNFHGMTLRCLMGDGADSLTSLVKTPLKPDQLTFFGLRSIDPEEARFINDESIAVFETEKTRSLGEDYPALKSKNLYIHVDIDSLDQSVFNECATPTSGGFRLEELIALISYYTQNYNIIGGCLTEYAPKDPQSTLPLVENILMQGFNLKEQYADDININYNKAQSQAERGQLSKV
ncbi:MAG: arginase family protein [Alphaproteobacteria bacterium]